MADDELEDYFLKISSNPLDNLSQYVAPHLVGQEWYWIRRALLIMLATQKDTNMRIRLHMLLKGDPGTGKTEFLLWTHENIGGVFINADLTSKVGLVGDARGLKIKPGLLADCNGNLIFLDELDKMASKDQSGLLQALEEGAYTIVKGSQRERFDAEVRVIAGANELKKIQRPLLDRFDFIFYVGTTPRRERADNVDKLVNSFISREEDNSKIITGYMEWIKDHDVNVFPDDEIKIKDLIRDYILRTTTNIDYVSYRSLELSILRIAYASARLERKTMDSSHVEKAIWLKDQILRGIVGVYTPTQ